MKANAVIAHPGSDTPALTVQSTTGAETPGRAADRRHRRSGEGRTVHAADEVARLVRFELTTSAFAGLRSIR